MLELSAYKDDTKMDSCGSCEIVMERCECIQSSAGSRYLVDVDFGYGFTGKILEKCFRFYFNRFSWLGNFLDRFQRVNDDDTHSVFTM